MRLERRDSFTGALEGAVVKKFVFIVGLFMLGACTVVYKMPEPPPAPKQQHL